MIKDVLLALTSYPDATPDASIDASLALGEALGAHVTAITFEAEIKLTHTTNMLTRMLLDVPLIIEEEKAKSASNAKHLLHTFEQSALRQKVAHAKLLQKSIAFQVPDVLVGHARLHDLTIIPLQDGYCVEQWYAEAVIFGSGRPAIILPPGKEVHALNTVVVAWDFSRTAARALGDALPILQKAKHVRLVTIRNDKDISEAHSHAELAQNLLRHGVGIEIDFIDTDGKPAGEALSRFVREKDADLLVMGAYGHARVKEFILGGVTKSMLDKPPVPVFLSH